MERERVIYSDWTKFDQPKRAYRCPAPTKIKFAEHNGRTVVANPAGVPAKWLPVYLECASRLYDGGPSFIIGADVQERGMPVTLRLRDECGSWSTFGDPIDAMRSLGITPIAPAPKVKAAPQMHRAFGIAAPAPIIEEIPANPSLPQWAEEWLAGLVFELKRTYARQYLEHLLCNAPAPADPATEWAGKARKRADRLIDQAA